MTEATPDSTTGSDDRTQCLATKPSACFERSAESEHATEDDETTLRRSSSTGFERIRRRVLVAGYTLMLGSPAIVGTVAAQGTVGSSLCGTPIANFINSAAPLVVALAMIVGTVFAYLMHSRAGLARDAEQAQFYLDWRNRAGYTAITAPLLAFLLQMMIGFTGTGVDACIDLVPFF